MRALVLKKNILSDDELRTFLMLQGSIKTIKDELSRIELESKEIEANLIAKIDNGATLASDDFEVSIREVSRRFPAWKEHFIELAGKDRADDVLEGTEAKLYRNLVIKSA